MAKIDKVLCPICIFKAKYIDLILTNDGLYICPNCNVSFSYEELMQLYSLTQLSYEVKKNNFKSDV